jgi:hypothetical protein
MPAARLTFRYACRLSFEAQAPVPAILAYRLVAHERNPATAIGYLPATRYPTSRWAAMVVRLATRVPRRLWAVGRHMVGGRPRATILMGSTWLGTVTATLRFRSRFDTLVAELRAARWLGGGPARVERKRRAAVAASADEREEAGELHAWPG